MGTRGCRDAPLPCPSTSTETPRDCTWGSSSCWLDDPRFKSFPHSNLPPSTKIFLLPLKTSSPGPKLPPPTQFSLLSRAVCASGCLRGMAGPWGGGGSWAHPAAPQTLLLEHSVGDKRCGEQIQALLVTTGTEADKGQRDSLGGPQWVQGWSWGGQRGQRLSRQSGGPGQIP